MPTGTNGLKKLFSIYSKKLLDLANLTFGQYHSTMKQILDLNFTIQSLSEFLSSRNWKKYDL